MPLVPKWGFINNKSKNKKTPTPQSLPADLQKSGWQALKARCFAGQITNETKRPVTILKSHATVLRSPLEFSPARGADSSCLASEAAGKMSVMGIFGQRPVSESQRTPEDSFLLKRFSLDRQLSHPTCAGFAATDKC